MATATKTARITETQRALVGELYGLGVDPGRIWHVLDLTASQFRYALKRLGGPRAYPDRPTDRGEVVRRTVRRYLELCREEARGSTLGTSWLLRGALHRLIVPEEGVLFLHGVEFAVEQLRRLEHRPEDAGYLKCLAAIFGPSEQDRLMEQPPFTAAWSACLEAAAARDPHGARHIQAARAATEALAREYLTHLRPLVAPQWPTEGRALIDAAVATLTEREQRVLCLRFGLQGERPHTLEEVGRVFNKRRERIRQIEAKALRKLRHPSRSKHLRLLVGQPGGTVEAILPMVLERFQCQQRRPEIGFEAARMLMLAQGIVSNPAFLPLLLRRCSELRCPKKVLRVLGRHGIVYLGDLIQRGEWDLQTLGIDPKSIEAIKLAAYLAGFRLDMYLEKVVQEQFLAMRSAALAPSPE